MAFFKFRRGGEDQSAATQQPESVETMRKRARHRLVGAAVLVLAGVVGLPVLFDRQPRPISVDLPIEIPDKGKVRPLPGTASNPAVVQAPTAGTVGQALPGVSSPVPAPGVMAPVPEKVAAAPVEEKLSAAPAASAAVASAASARRDVVSKSDTPAPAMAKPAAGVDEAAKAQALLDGKDAPQPVAAEGRFVVQVGAFSDVAKAREARMKVERAGLKTYTQVVDTKEGRRTRVRVGPFADRTEADKAAAKIKKLDLAAAVLVL